MTNIMSKEAGRRLVDWLAGCEEDAGSVSTESVLGKQHVAENL